MLTIDNLHVRAGDKDILKGLSIIFVNHVDEVLPQALIAGSDALYMGRQSDHPLYLTLRKADCQDNAAGPPTH